LASKPMIKTYSVKMLKNCNRVVSWRLPKTVNAYKIVPTEA